MTRTNVSDMLHKLWPDGIDEDCLDRLQAVVLTMRDSFKDSGKILSTAELAGLGALDQLVPIAQEERNLPFVAVNASELFAVTSFLQTMMLPKGLASLAAMLAVDEALVRKLSKSDKHELVTFLTAAYVLGLERLLHRSIAVTIRWDATLELPIFVYEHIKEK